MSANSRAASGTAVFFSTFRAVFSRIANFELFPAFLTDPRTTAPFTPDWFLATVCPSMAILTKGQAVVWIVASFFIISVCPYMVDIQDDILTFAIFCPTLLACIVISLQDGIYECFILLGFVSGLSFFGTTSFPHRVVLSDEMCVSRRYISSLLDAFTYCGSMLLGKFTTREGIGNLLACFIGQFPTKTPFVAHRRLGYFLSHGIPFGRVVDFVPMLGFTGIRAKLSTSTPVVFTTLFADFFIILRHDDKIAKGKVGCNPK